MADSLFLIYCSAILYLFSVPARVFVAKQHGGGKKKLVRGTQGEDKTEAKGGSRFPFSPPPMQGKLLELILKVFVIWFYKKGDFLSQRRR